MRSSAFLDTRKGKWTVIETATLTTGAKLATYHRFPDQASAEAFSSGGTPAPAPTATVPGADGAVADALLDSFLPQRALLRVAR